MPYPFTPKLSLKHAPTLWQCLHDDNPFRIVVGPLGSGKTTFCCADVFSRAMQQEPNAEGWRPFKCGTIRNTMPELRRTTVPSWLELFPEEATAPMRWSSPAEHAISIRPEYNDQREIVQPGINFTNEFFGLDTAKDVRHLLSWQGTMLWFNEIREILKSIIDMGDLRVGRHPSVAQGGVDASWFGMLGDTNAPDEDHWIYRADKGVDDYGMPVGRPKGWSFYFQPPAVIEMVKVDGGWESAKSETVKLTVEDPNRIHKAAGTLWAVNPHAENLPNLPVNRAIDPDMDPLGPGGYYARGMQGKARDWIRCYFQGHYQYVREGLPVIEEFDEQLMVRDDLPIMDDGFYVGGDIGGNTLNPAAILFQRGPRGVWLVHGEVIGSGMGLDRFENELRVASKAIYGDRPCIAFYGDPAGRTRDGIFETVAFDHLLSKGWPALPAPSQDIGVRIDAWKAPMNRMIDGQPGILIARKCAKTIKALAGAWHFRRLNTQGQARYAIQPDKNHPYSDLGDAGGYGLSGAGETGLAKSNKKPDPLRIPGEGPIIPDRHEQQRIGTTPFQAQTDFDPFNF